MRIGFTKTVQYENEGRHQGPIFQAGDVYDCADDFAQRWLERGVAVNLDGGRDPAKGQRWTKVEKHDFTLPGAGDAEGADETEIEPPAGGEGGGAA